MTRTPDHHVKLRDFVERVIAEKDRFWEHKLADLKCKMKLELEQRDKALALQAKANQVHFESLNHEAARILEASKRTVSADTWAAFEKADSAWKDYANRQIQEAVTREDFQSYRAATDRAFQLNEGALQMRTRLFSIIAAVAGITAVISFIFAIK